MRFLKLGEFSFNVLRILSCTSAILNILYFDKLSLDNTLQCSIFTLSSTKIFVSILTELIGALTVCHASPFLHPRIYYIPRIYYMSMVYEVLRNCLILWHNTNTLAMWPDDMTVENWSGLSGTYKVQSRLIWKLTQENYVSSWVQGQHRQSPVSKKREWWEEIARRTQ